MIRLKYYWDRSLTDWPYRILLHTGFWAFLFFFWTRESVVLKINLEQHFSVTLVGIGLGLFLFYPLVYGIVPLYMKRRWIVATLLLAAYYIIAVIFRSYNIQLIVNWYNLSQTWIVGRDFWPQIYETQFNAFSLSKIIFSSIPSLLDVIYVPLTIKFIRYAYRFNLRQSQLARENAQLQLQTLKAQINPHFFFNTLNNLQSFIVQNEKERSIALMNQLGDFMRASLYDHDSEYITMAQEIELLTNYVAIEQVRFDEQADIRIRFIDQDPEFRIPPFIFLPFIENVFKHGGALPVGRMFMEIELVNASQIILRTVNNVDEEGATDTGGIGIDNIRKRLALYFPGKYQLEIHRRDGRYELTLIIDKV